MSYANCLFFSFQDLHIFGPIWPVTNLYSMQEKEEPPSIDSNNFKGLQTNPKHCQKPLPGPVWPYTKLKEVFNFDPKFNLHLFFVLSITFKRISHFNSLTAKMHEEDVDGEDINDEESKEPEDQGTVDYSTVQLGCACSIITPTPW